MNLDLFNQTQLDMQDCLGNDGRSIWEHGQSVAMYADLLGYRAQGQVTRDLRLPKWFDEWGSELINQIPSWDMFRVYLLWHDCGKPYCKKVDGLGRISFPDHAWQSYKRWTDMEPSSDYVAQCILHDLDIHTLKGASEVKAFASLSVAPSLLISGLAEIHANAEMFGGLDSSGFKIKFAQIERRGRDVCRLILP